MLRHLVSDLNQKISTYVKPLILITGLLTASISPALVSTGIAHADINNTRNDAWGTQEVAQNGWLNGNGGSIYSNGSTADWRDCSGNIVSTYAAACKNSVNGVVSGAEWQCVEMINRLYLKQSWITATWTGDGGSIYNANPFPPNLSKEAYNAVSYINPGDVLTLTGGPTGSGHAGIINTFNGSAIGLASQNTSAVYDNSNFTFSGSTISKTGWAQYNLQGIVHQPNGPFTSAPSAFIDSSGNYNVLAEQFGNSVQYERSGSTWNGQPITSSTTLVGKYTPLALSDSSGNYYLFVATGGGVNEYEKASGSGSWNSGSVVESTGVPTSGIGGFIDSSGNINIFFTTSGGWDHYKYSSGSWTGEVPATGTFLSTPSAFADSSGNYHVFVQSTGSINHYVYSGSTWNGEQAETGSTFISPPSAFVDPSGNLNFFVNTTGGMNHYEKSGGGSWGGEVVTNNSSLIYWPASYYSSYSGGYYIVYTETAGAIQQYWRAASGGSWGNGTPATLSPTSGISVALDSSYNDNIYVNTIQSLNHYEHTEGTGTWGGEVVSTGR